LTKRCFWFDEDFVDHLVNLIGFPGIGEQSLASFFTLHCAAQEKASFVDGDIHIGIVVISVSEEHAL